MADFTLNGMLEEIVEVLSVLTNSEELLLSQVRGTRMAREVKAASAVRVAPILEPTVLEDRHPDTEEVANSGPVEDPRSATMSPAMRADPLTPMSESPPREEAPTESWDTSRATPNDSSTGSNFVTRDYDYFAELDKKLAGLEQRNLNSRDS
jgi:hypothetical protein